MTCQFFLVREREISIELPREGKTKVSMWRGNRGIDVVRHQNSESWIPSNCLKGRGYEAAIEQCGFHWEVLYDKSSLFEGEPWSGCLWTGQFIQAADRLREVQGGWKTCS